MSTWSSGYVTDLGYTHGFYRELTPAVLALGALSKSMMAPPPEAHLAYCELGCGQGFSANLLAAANPHIQFYANDFNPAHIAGAQQLATAARRDNVHFYEDSFADFGSNPNLPQFDIISLHGIYTWISAENRAHIVEFIRRKLKPGGLVYISYNSLPGWAAAAPLRQLIYAHGNAQVGQLPQKLEAAFGFIEKLIATKPGYFAGNKLDERFARLRTQSRNYLVHEYLNDAWTLFYFSDVASELERAKLSFVGSAHIMDHIDAINLSDEQRKLLAEIVDPILRETTRDYMINQQFRRDIFGRGMLRYETPQLADRWRDMRVVLTTPRAKVPLKTNGARGEANLTEAIYTPILDRIAGGPVSLRELQADPQVSRISWSQLVEAILVLVGTGHLQPCLPASGEDERHKSTRIFNIEIIRRAARSGDLQSLASPVTGGGVNVDRLHLLFMLAHAQKAPDQLAFAWNALKSIGHRLLKDGKPIESDEENIKLLGNSYTAFQEALPTYQQLKLL